MENNSTRPVQLSRDFTGRAGDWVAIVGNTIVRLDMQGLTLANPVPLAMPVDPGPAKEPPPPPRPKIARTNRQEEVYAVFTDYRPRSTAEIAAQMNLSSDTVTRWLCKLQLQGRLERMTRGLYRKVRPDTYQSPPPPPEPAQPEAGNGRTDLPF